MTRGRRAWFAVVCSECLRTILIARRVGDAELRVLRDHLRTCADPPIDDGAPLGAVMRRVRVVASGAR